MRCLARLVLTVVGLTSLLLGGYLLYTVYLDQPETTTRTLGGSNQSVQEVAADGLDVTIVDTDTGEAPPANIGATTDLNQTEVSIAASDTTSLDSRPNADANQVRDQANTAFSPELTSDYNPALENEVINEGTTVEVVTLEDPNAAPVNGDDGVGGGGTIFQYEQRLAELEFPQVFREGESGAVRVTLRSIEGGVAAVAEIDGNTVMATPILLTQYYGTHDAFVTARIVAPEFEVEESNSARQQMLQAQPVTWRWTLTPNETGRFVITFGVEVRWVPKDPNTAQEIGPLPLWGQSVQTQVDQVFGLISIPEASVAGTILAVLGALSQIPFVMELANAIFERQLNKIRDGDKSRTRRS